MKNLILIFSGLALLAIFSVLSCKPTVEETELSTELNSKEQLGKLLFFETSLSTPVGQDCSDCHKPEFAFADPDTRLNIVGDASMAPFELMAADGSIYVEERSGKPSIDQLKFLSQTFPHSVWLNPVSSQRWENTNSITTIRQIFPMFELSLDGLDAAVKYLMTN